MNFFREDHFFNHQDITITIKQNENDDECLFIYFEYQNSSDLLIVNWNFNEEKIESIICELNVEVTQTVNGLISARQYLELTNFLCENNPFDCQLRGMVIS